MEIGIEEMKKQTVILESNVKIEFKIHDTAMAAQLRGRLIPIF